MGPFDSLPLDWLRAKPGKKWHGRQGVLNAWIADMDVPPPPVVTAALQRLLDGGDLGYPDWRHPTGGSPASDAFVARAARRWGWSPGIERIRELNDVVQGVQLVLHAFTSPGDGVILHVPAYPPFFSALEETGCRMLPVTTFDPDEVEAIAPQARVLLLCHPHNPTGHVFTDDELGALADIAERHDLLVLSDEIHADLTYAPRRHRPMALDAPHRTVTLHAPSKAFNLAGLRFALMHVGDDRVWQALRDLPDHITGASNLAGVAAAEAAWRDGDDWLAQVVAHLDAQRHLLADLLTHHLPEVRYTPPEATYLAWLDCRGLGLGDDPSQTFLTRGVRLSEGPNFGETGHGFARLNFATSAELLRLIVATMAG